MHSTPGATPSPVTIKELQRPLAQAEDARLFEVVSLIDSMAERGLADALIAPLRPRLRRLRPARRLSLRRLLFTPADPIIVAAPQWKRQALTIPRSALSRLAAQITQSLGEAGDVISATLAAAATTDPNIMLRCGQQIWPKAAEALAQSEMPADWSDSTGLAAADYAAIARPLSVLLRQGFAIEAMVQRGAAADALAAPLRACLSETMAYAARTPAPQQAVGMVAAVLLARLDVSEPVITTLGDLAASQASPAARQACDMAIGLALDHAEAAPAAHGDLGEATEALDRVAGLLEALNQPGPSHRPALKARVAQLRRTLDAACRARFDSELAELAAELAQAPAGDLSDDAAMEREAAVLALRCFELTSRAFGGAAHYERQLHDIARHLAELPPPAGSCMDRARLLEILEGPQAGLAYLHAFGTGYEAL